MLRHRLYTRRFSKRKFQASLMHQVLHGLSPLCSVLKRRLRQNTPGSHLTNHLSRRNVARRRRIFRAVICSRSERLYIYSLYIYLLHRIGMTNPVAQVNVTYSIRRALGSSVLFQSSTRDSKLSSRRKHRHVRYAVSEIAVKRSSIFNAFCRPLRAVRRTRRRLLRLLRG